MPRVAGGIVELHVLKDIYCSNKHTIFSQTFENTHYYPTSQDLHQSLLQWTFECKNSAIWKINAIFVSQLFCIHRVHIVVNILEGINIIFLLFFLHFNFIIRQNKFVTTILRIIVFVTVIMKRNKILFYICDKEKQFSIFTKFF